MKSVSIFFLILSFVFITGCGLTEKEVNKSNKQGAQGGDTLAAPVDSDGDGMLDSEEAKYGTDPKNPDSDGDGLGDGEEIRAYGTDPLDADTDDGGISDGAEVSNGTNPLNGIDDISADNDSDGDGLNDEEEINAGTDPENSDSDGDGLSDGSELNAYLTDPLDADTDDGGTNDGDEVAQGTNPRDNPVDDSTIANDADGDGLSDSDEAIEGTDPNNPDSDDDGLTDGAEVNSLGTDPNNADTDDGGVDDGSEVSSGTDPLNGGDDDTDSVDSDSDGLSDLKESQLGTDPNDPDTDEDGVTDGAEVQTHGTDPKKADTDDGGISDGEELSLGTDPFDPIDDFEKPVIKFIKAPKVRKTGSRAKFEVTVQDANKIASVQCSLDGVAILDCDINKLLDFKGVEVGVHVFSVTVVDIVGRVSSAQYQWERFQRVFAGCDGTQRRLVEETLVFPAVTETCEFGVGDNLAKKNAYLTAVREQTQEFSVGNKWDVCEIELEPVLGSFKADDHFALSWNDKVLISNAEFMLSNSPSGKVFDFNSVKGMKFGSESGYCFASETDGSCAIPAHNKDQEFAINLGAESKEQLLSHINKSSRQTIKLEVTGDNDNSDCKHSGLVIQVRYYKARVN